MEADNINMPSTKEEQSKPKFDPETKIRLLIALINDEGNHKLEISMEKLVNRLFESFETHASTIKKYLVES